MEQEGAAHLTDILHRRTMIGLEPGWGREIHREVAELAAPLLGWSADDVRREVAAHDTYVAERLLGGVARTNDVTELVPRPGPCAAGSGARLIGTDGAERNPMLPTTLVGCSSKSYFSVEQATRWGPEVVDGVADDPAGTDGLFVCPSFPLIPTLLASFGAAGRAGRRAGRLGAPERARTPARSAPRCWPSWASGW